jgi:hypothetical protein
VIYKQEVTVQ